LAEHADPGDEPRDGAPILSALALRGHVPELIELAARWRCPPPLFASLMFVDADERTAAALLEADAIGRLAACPRDRWAGGDGWWMTDWWLAADAHGDPFGACRAVMGLVAARPWTRTQGRLVDLIRLVRATVAGG
jgi:hypothetical protein